MADRYRPEKSCHYSSHLPMLNLALSITTGDVLEMGVGFYSTPFIHWFCVPRQRHVVSVDNVPGYHQMSNSFTDAQYHRLILVENWDLPELDKPWDVVFIDHAPALRRRVDILRFANLAKLIVVHDTNGRDERHYHLKEIWPQFKYRLDYYQHYPMTTMVSNYMDIRGLRVC